MSGDIEWSEEQWNRVRQTVHDEALRARVAASFLPLFGPLPSDTQSVPVNVLGAQDDGSGPGERLEVNDYETMRLSTVSINIYLKNAQISDPELTSALIMFRRAAAIMARVEDAIIFNGQAGVGQGPVSGLGTSNMPLVYQLSGGGAYQGLLDAGKSNGIVPKGGKGIGLGEQVFAAVVDAVRNLESAGYLGPFACVMGDALFRAVTTPLPNSMVLPRDSILPFLDGPLLRSSAVDEGQAVLVSLAGAPVEIVVPGDISVRYLQATTEAEHVFRIQQKFVLRIKETSAISTIQF